VFRIIIDPKLVTDKSNVEVNRTRTISTDPVARWYLVTSNTLDMKALATALEMITAVANNELAVLSANTANVL
jgi:hypothetical protein